MQVQINTDHNIEGHEALAARVREHRACAKRPKEPAELCQQMAYKVWFSALPVADSERGPCAG
jgi:hypothetical protein